VQVARGQGVAKGGELVAIFVERDAGGDIVFDRLRGRVHVADNDCKRPK